MQIPQKYFTLILSQLSTSTFSDVFSEDASGQGCQRPQ